MAVKEAFLGLSLHKTKDHHWLFFQDEQISLFFHSLFWSSVLNTHRPTQSFRFTLTQVILSVRNIRNTDGSDKKLKHTETFTHLTLLMHTQAHVAVLGLVA